MRIPSAHEGAARPTAADRRRTLPDLGRRGGGWVVIQVVLLTAIFLSALVGGGWPASLEPLAYSIGGLLIAAGLGMLVAGGGALARIAALTAFPAPRGDTLQTSGIYRLVRHPMYGGGILTALGWSAVFASLSGLVLTIALIGLAEMKARREESWLEQRFAGYAEYRRQTRWRLIPFVL